jgi:hypothetical protein
MARINVEKWGTIVPEDSFFRRSLLQADKRGTVERQKSQLSACDQTTQASPLRRFSVLTADEVTRTLADGAVPTCFADGALPTCFADGAFADMLCRWCFCRERYLRLVLPRCGSCMPDSSCARSMASPVARIPTRS